MDVTLSPDSEQFVREKLQHGHFQSATDVVNAGLRLLQEHERWTEAVREKLVVAREELNEGKAITPEQLDQNMAARKAKWKTERGLA